LEALATPNVKTGTPFLGSAYNELLAHAGLPFSEMTPAMVTEDPGVYLITAKEGHAEVPYYVGQSGCLRERLYRNHLMGQPQSNARLKKYLIEFAECDDAQEAKEFIQDRCVARWIEKTETRERSALEGYFTGLLFPKYGLGFER